MNNDEEQWWKVVYYEQWRNSKYICFNLLTLLNYFGGLRGGKCCGQERQPQQLSEEECILCIICCG